MYNNWFFFCVVLDLPSRTSNSCFISDSYGVSAVSIGKRVGHKSEKITFYYAHLFPGVEEKMAEQPNEEMKME